MLIFNLFWGPDLVLTLDGTVCPRSSDPFYIVKLLYEMGHYFLDKQQFRERCAGIE